MAFDTNLAERVRTYLAALPSIAVEEKKMFGGLAFMINGKMCVNVSANQLMCRYNPEMELEISERVGYQPMIMRGKEMKGYCYVDPEGFQSDADFNFWLKLCLDFNDRAKASK